MPKSPEDILKKFITGLTDKKMQKKILAKQIDNLGDATKYAVELRQLVWDKPFHLYTDASSIAAGYLLAQEHGPIAYGCMNFNLMERKYKTYELEAYTVVLAKVFENTFALSLIHFRTIRACLFRHGQS